MKKIFIAIPTIGSIRIELAKFLLNIIHSSRYQIAIDMVSLGDICHNRNLLVKKFLQTKCDYILFCDSDIVPPMNILEMIKDDKDIVAPVNFTFKNGDLVPLMLKKNKQGYEIDKKAIDNKNYLVEVEATGLGCILIKQEVFNKLKKPCFQYILDEDGLIKRGEDFNFCGKARKAGYKIYVDKRFMTNHFSTVNLKEVNKMGVRNGR